MENPINPKFDFDEYSCQIGDPNDDYGDRLPSTTIRLKRCGNATRKDSSVWKLCEFIVSDSRMNFDLVGLNADDVHELAEFLLRYEQRLRDY